MEAIVERCCGLDVHQRTVVACLIIGEARAKPSKTVRRYGTTTRELKAMRAWLLSMGCSEVAMESTGVYRQPVYAVLEGHFEIVVGNAHHIKNVPGRKTDVKDSEWIGDLGPQAARSPPYIFMLGTELTEERQHRRFVKELRDRRASAVNL